MDALFGIVDVLSIVDHRGPSTIDELESAAPPDAGLWVVLDTCVDSGWLDARGWGDGSLEDSRYCLTPMGRRILEVSVRCALAA